MTSLADPVTTPTTGHRRGTIHRSCTPEQTRERITPLLDRFGITRVADITGLDEVGIPVHVAYRPGGTTLSVSIGIGVDPVRSWVGAAMESVELWHAENVRLPVLRAAAADLDLPYELGELALAPYSPLTRSTVVDWVWGRGMLTGHSVPVPRGLVELDATRPLDWDGVLFDATSNGMGVGATLAEATLHAVLEVAERDACAPFLATPLARRRHVDPAGADSDSAATILSALRAAGCWVELCETTNGLGLPSFACTLWAPDLPLTFLGFGCHLDAGTAVSRALAEATLGRAATISGARDDIGEDAYHNAEHVPDPTGVVRELHPVGPSAELPADCPDSAVALASHCAGLMHRATGREPVVVDLTHPAIGVPAVKVIAPGLRMLDHALMSSRPSEGHG